jgi:hypothetical protein
MEWRLQNMQDKAETIIVHVTWVLAILCLIVGTYVRPVLLLNIQMVFLMLVYGYAVYWSLGLRRLLSAPLYRNQALGGGLIALGWAAFNASNVVVYGIASKSNNVEGPLPLALVGLALLVTFYWIDSSILAGRKSDPLYRNTLHWKELRLVLWPLIAGAIIIFWLVYLSDPAALNPTSVSVTPLFLVLLFTLVGGTFGSGLVLIPVSRRSRDRTLRKNLEWFALFPTSFLVFVILGTLVGGTPEPGNVALIFQGLPFIVGSYCIYRSVKSLAPLNEMPQQIVAKQT